MIIEAVKLVCEEGNWTSSDVGKYADIIGSYNRLFDLMRRCVFLLITVR